MGHSTKIIDLTGQRFGKITVLHKAENLGVKTAWLCQCDCGQEIVVRTNSLRSGHTRSCGCAGGPQNARQGLTYVDGTCVEILRSKKIQKNNTSGVPGVTWIQRDRLWRATICFKGKRHYLGGYRRLEDAVKARKRAEESLYDSFLDDYVGARSQNSKS